MPSLRLQPARGCLQSRWLSALLVAGTLGTLGCAHFRRTRECTALAQAVSSWLAEVPKADAGVADSPRIAEEARATARRYAELDAKLAALDVKSPELAPRVRRYREMTQQATRALNDVASAVERKDGDLARQRRVEFDATARSEAPLVAEINALCRR